MWLARARGFLWVSALLAGLMAAPVGAQDDQASHFSPAEEDAIRQLVRDYLLANPEVLMEAAQAYRERQQEIQQQQAREALISRREELDQDPDSPVLGNPDGDVVVVEFFDYRSGRRTLHRSRGCSRRKPPTARGNALSGQRADHGDLRR